MKKFDVFTFIIVAILKIVGALIELLIPICISDGFDNYIKEGFTNKTIIYCVLMVLSIIFAFIFNYSGNYLAAKNANRIVRNRKIEFIRKLNKADNLTFSKLDKNNLITTLNLDFNNYYLFLQNIQRLGIRCPVLLFGSLGLCIYYSLKVSIPLMISIPLVVGIILLFSIIGVRITKEIQNNYTSLGSKTRESYYGYKQIKIYDTKNNEKNKFEKKNKKLFNSVFNSLFISQLSNFFTTAILDIIFVFILYLSAKSINISITTGNYLAFIALYSTISHSTLSMSKLVIIISRGISSNSRINSYDIEEIKKLENNYSSNNFLELKDINFKYNENDKFGFSNLNLAIENKTNIEIVGKIASGKTTLIKLISGLYIPNDGNIILEKKHINELEKKDFGYAWQDDYLFQNTILYNITLDREYDENDLLLAIKTSKADSFINGKKDGLLEKIGGVSNKVSGGERSRILLARSLLNQPKYLFLDNIFESIYYVTEKEILNNIKTNYKDTILISCNQKILEEKDYFIIIEDNGNLVHGYYNDVLENSFFNNLVLERQE